MSCRLISGPPRVCGIWPAMLILALGGGDVLFAANTEGDRSARGVLFADQHVIESARDVHLRAAALSAEDRFETLSRWVLPGADHDTFRLAVGFLPTHPAPADRNHMPARTERHSEQAERRIGRGGELVSPALDLIRVAEQLGRLTEVRTRIEQAKVDDERQQRCQLAMLVLVDLALGDYERALTSSDELLVRVVARPLTDFTGRWPDTLVVHQCLQHEQTKAGVEQLVYQLLQNQVRSGIAHGPPAWDRWVTASFGRLELAKRNSAVQPVAATSPTPIQLQRQANLANWQPVSRTTGYSRGQGLPLAAWHLSPGLARNDASHDEDYLYYAVPLRGEFEVECDVTSFGWQDSHLMVAGTYVAPVYDHVTYRVGSFGMPRPMGTIEPRLSESAEWLRYRTVVEDNVCSTFFNGRHIHSEPLAEGHDPWLAIRSPSYADGGVRNLTIRGNPSIPDSIDLLPQDGLIGWSPYHGEPVTGPQAYWRIEQPAGDRELVGIAEPWLAGQSVERLLQYHRPMLEDGTIRYEFFFRDGESLVHPALDRKVFVLGNQGVGVHWQTDGVFERTAASPRQVVDEPESRRGPQTLPLQPNRWNRMELAIRGDVVSLLLNDVLIYQSPIAPTNLRTFGLFHWADESEARVRNIHWAGDWPRQLPPVEEQALADQTTIQLAAETATLPMEFVHDFAKDGLPARVFRTEGAMTRTEVLPGKGVRLTIPGREGYIAGWICPLLRVHGDFDIRAEFESLVTVGPEDSSCGIALQVITDDPQVTHSLVYRGRLRTPGLPDQTIMQAEFNRQKLDGRAITWPGTTAEESTSGTLRLIRRGRTMSCLFAEADSLSYRLVHSETVPDEPTLFACVRLRGAITSATADKSETAVTWKRLAIRAEDITMVP